MQIAWGELCWERARLHAGRRGNRANSLGELRWEGAVQHAGRIGNFGNSLRRASLGGSDTAIVTACWTERKPWNFAESFAGSETACWTETKPWKSPAESFAGRERDSMLDGEETVQIACGKLRTQGARQHSSRGNGLGRDQCRAVGAALSELLARFFSGQMSSLRLS